MRKTMLVYDQDTQAYLSEVLAKAIGMGLLQQLLDRLHYLAHYAEERGKQEGFVVRTTLWKDFAPLSFRFTHEITRDGETWESWFGGGLIYEGPDVPADGSFPSLTVSVGSDGKPGWRVHT